jgi:hypothetical protein
VEGVIDWEQIKGFGKSELTTKSEITCGVAADLLKEKVGVVGRRDQNESEWRGRTFLKVSRQ